VTNRSVYVTGLAWETNEDELSAHFSSAGNVVNAVILRQYRRGNPRSSMGCGIVEFETQAMADSAIQSLHDSELRGRKIRCREDRAPFEKVQDVNLDESVEEEVFPESSPAMQSSTVISSALTPPNRASSVVPDRRTKKSDDSKREVDPYKIFASSLTWDTTVEELTTFFSEAGLVVSAEVLSTRKGRSMGSGIVEFADESSVDRAIELLSGKILNGRAVSVRNCYK